MLGRPQVCCRAGCDQRATMRAMLRLFPFIGDDPAELYVGVGFCDDHAKPRAIRELLEHVPLREQLEEALRSRGLAPPFWPRCDGRFVPLEATQ